MSDLICRKTMMRCNTPGTCSPHGGCRDDRDAALAAKDARIAELERALSLTSGAYRQCVSEVSATPSEDGGEVGQLLVTALRQYQHNDCSGLLAGYDCAEAKRIVSDLIDQHSRIVAAKDAEIARLRKESGK